MISLDDKRWKTFEGGYRIKYDASIPLLKLKNATEPNDQIWLELWDELHHQGDVGIASYAAIPHISRIIRDGNILDYNPFALAVTIELARERGNNPRVPAWLEADYNQALADMAEYACEKHDRDWDSSLVKSVLSLKAILKGTGDLGELIINIGDGEEKQVLEMYFDR
jgi:hypothetical protein